MNILVTGGAGFIGNYVVKNLEALNHNVTVVDSVTTYGVLDPVELEWLHKERTKTFSSPIVKMDLMQHNAVRSVMELSKPEIVIHLAAFPRAKVVDKDPQLGANVLVNALINLLQTAKDNGCKKFVYISSSMVYGNFDDATKEDVACSPQGFYGILKYTGEMLVKDFCTRNNMSYTIIRPSAVYGPLDVEDRVVSKFLLNAMRGNDIAVHGAGEFLDFSYVTDVASGITNASLSDQTNNKTYNMTRGRSRSLLEAAQIAVAVTGSKSSIIVQDKNPMFPSRGSLDISSAHEDLGFNPKVDIEEGFKLYYESLKDSIFWAKSSI